MVVVLRLFLTVVLRVLGAEVGLSRAGRVVGVVVGIYSWVMVGLLVVLPVLKNLFVVSGMKSVL